MSKNSVLRVDALSTVLSAYSFIYLSSKKENTLKSSLGSAFTCMLWNTLMNSWFYKLPGFKSENTWNDSSRSFLAFDKPQKKSSMTML